MNRLLDGFPKVRDVIFNEIVEHHQIRVEDVPSWEDTESSTFTALLSRDYARLGSADIPALREHRDDSMEEDGSMGNDLEYEGGNGREGGESLTDLDGRRAQDSHTFSEEEHETPSFELVRQQYFTTSLVCRA